MQLAKDTLSDFPRIRKRLAAATRDLNWYDRDELYEGRGKRKHLSRRVVSEQIALLLASFANLKPGSPEEFSHMTVKRCTRMIRTRLYWRARAVACGELRSS